MGVAHRVADHHGGTAATTKPAILNSDGIRHNIHTFSTANAPINKAQPRFKKVITETFGEPEIIRVQCDVHSWMQGWIVVKPHPFFAAPATRGWPGSKTFPPASTRSSSGTPFWANSPGRWRQKAGEVRVAFEMKK